VGGLGTDNAASKIYNLWSGIYRLWEESNESDGVSENNCNKAIDIFSELLDLIDKETDPHDYCVALRMRAQNYCMAKKYDDALKDLHRERDFNRRNNDQVRVDRCEKLISRISSWHSSTKGSVDGFI